MNNLNKPSYRKPTKQEMYDQLLHQHKLLVERISHLERNIATLAGNEMVFLNIIRALSSFHSYPQKEIQTTSTILYADQSRTVHFDGTGMFEFTNVVDATVAHTNNVETQNSEEGD